MGALPTSAATSSFSSGPYLDQLLQVASNGEKQNGDPATETWILEMCERIAQRRVSLDLDPEDVVARLRKSGAKISVQGYKRWEVKGPPLTPGTSRLGELAAALECEPGWILHGDIQQAPAPRLVHRGPGEDDVFGLMEGLAVGLAALEVTVAGIADAVARLEQQAAKPASRGGTKQGNNE